MAPREVCAFAPGRVNLIGEHTDYNRGLALPFAIAEGVTVRARATDERRVRAHALDLGERVEFALPNRSATGSLPSKLASAQLNQPRLEGWQAFVYGVAAELLRARVALVGADLEISGTLPPGAGLSSSAALEISLGLALLGLAGVELAERVGAEQVGAERAGAERAGAESPSEPHVPRAAIGRCELARLCSRVENDWVGARTGLLDQLASLFGQTDAALRIDFATLDIQPVPLALRDGWRLVTLDSGEPRKLAASGYNERRAECARACALLGVDSLREVQEGALDELPPVLARRAGHVLAENARVLATVCALRDGDLPRVGALLDASHASLRDLYECSTPAVEAAVRRLKEAGAAGARIVGGGFGGHVLGLLPPGVSPPAQAREVHPSRGAHLAPAPH